MLDHENELQELDFYHHIGGRPFQDSQELRNLEEVILPHHLAEIIPCSLKIECFRNNGLGKSAKKSKSK